MWTPVEYYDRKTLRDASQTSFYYDVCLELENCDPLRLYDYYVARQVVPPPKVSPKIRIKENVPTSSHATSSKLTVASKEALHLEEEEPKGRADGFL